MSPSHTCTPRRRPRQLRLLKDGVDIVVGTPGRVIDFVESGKIALDQVGAGLDQVGAGLDQVGQRGRRRWGWRGPARMALGHGFPGRHHIRLRPCT